MAGVGHQAAQCNEDPTTPSEALEIVVGRDTDLLWVNVANDSESTVWLHLFDARLEDLPGDPAAPHAFPATPVLPNSARTIPISVTFSTAISALASANEDGTGAPAAALFVEAAYASA